MITMIYMPEDYIITQGDISDKLYFLAIGHCEVIVFDEFKKPNKPEDRIVLIPGSMFGEIGLLCECPRTASVKCGGYVTCAYIDKTQFKDLCI